MDVLAQFARALLDGSVRVVDLSHPLRASTPVIGLPPPMAQSSGFSMAEISHYDDRGPAWYWNDLHMGEHTGTHFDAPAHWVTGRDVPDGTLDRIDPQRLIAPACVIDCTDEATADEGFLLQPAHIEAWEARHGRIPPGCWVLMRTGWSHRGDPAQFLNNQANEPLTPGPSVDAVRLLLERDVTGWGVETVGTDAGQAFGFDPPFPAHALMHGSGRFGLASLANLDQLPQIGALLITAPLRIEGGSGSPLRVLALVPGRAT